MAGKSSKATDKKIIDVAHPDTVAASPTARPLIVKRAVLKDPMVVDEADAIVGTEEVKAPSVTKIKIEPLHGDEPLDAPAAKPAATKDLPAAPTIADLAARVASRTKDAKAEEPAKETNDSTVTKITVTTAPKVAKPLVDKISKKEPETTAEEIAEPVSKEEAATVAKPKAEAEPMVEQPAAKKETAATEDPGPEPEKDPEPVDDKPEETSEDEGDKGTAPMDEELSEEAKVKHAAEQKQRAMVNKLAESGAYILPINAVEKRRFRRVAYSLVVLLVVAGIVWLDLALDAQLVTIPNVSAPTHFFPDHQK